MLEKFDTGFENLIKIITGSCKKLNDMSVDNIKYTERILGAVTILCDEFADEDLDAYDLFRKEFLNGEE